MVGQVPWLFAQFYSVKCVGCFVVNYAKINKKGVEIVVVIAAITLGLPAPRRADGLADGNLRPLSLKLRTSKRI